MVKLVRHRRPKGPVTDRPSLKPPRHISTLHLRGCLGSSEFWEIAPISRLCLPEWAWLRLSAVFSSVQVTERALEERCRKMWVDNIETGRVVSFAMFEGDQG